MLPASLPHNTTKGADRDIFFGVGHCYPLLGAKRVNKVMVASACANMSPALPLQSLNDKPAVHGESA